MKSIVQIGITAVLNVILPAAGMAVAAAVFASAAAGAAITTGLSGGTLSQTLKSAAIAGASAFAFYVVGSATTAMALGTNFSLSAPHYTPEFGSSAHIFQVAGHAAVGCGQSVASGGSCASGAAAGAVGAAGGPLMGSLPPVGKLAASAALGGAGSVATGGNFANGAITGAFGYMFNAEAGRFIGGLIGGALFQAYVTLEDGPIAGLAARAIGAYIGGQIGSDIEDWYNRPATAGVLVSNEGQLVFLESGSIDPLYSKYPAAGHAEAKAAIWIRENGSSGGVFFHNHPTGTCGMCNSNIPTLLPPNATLTVVPPEGAVGGRGWFSQPKTYTGNNRSPWD